MHDTSGKVNFQVGANYKDLQTLDLNIYKDDKSSTVTNNVNNAKGYSLENLIAAAGITDADAKFKVKADGTTTTATTGDVYTVFNVKTSAAAQATLKNIDKVINLIDTKRGDFGALENRMSSTISNQTNIMNNESDARSRLTSLARL